MNKDNMNNDYTKKDNESGNFMKDLNEMFEKIEKEGKVVWNPDTKPGFFTSTLQPNIFWKPVKEGRKFECSSCGIIAKICCLKDNNKIFACDNCWLTMFKKK